jgi:hypothetical protein
MYGIPPVRFTVDYACVTQAAGASGKFGLLPQLETFTRFGAPFNVTYKASAPITGTGASATMAFTNSMPTVEHLESFAVAARKAVSVQGQG